MQQSQQNSDTQVVKPQPEKKTYTAPRLVRQGKIEEMTLAVTNPGPSDEI